MRNFAQSVIPARETQRFVVGAVAVAAFLLLLLVPLRDARAVIEIEVTRGSNTAVPIAIVPFGWEGSGEPPLDTAAVVASDLQSSGHFAPLNRADLVATPTSDDRPRFQNWRLSNTDYLLVGKTRREGKKGYVVEFRLYNVVLERLMTGFEFQVTDQSLRSAAHEIADKVYEEITGTPGSFNSQIAYVRSDGSVGNRTYRLELADADGFNEQPILTSPRPIMSPAWAPDGVRVAYVSFENRTRAAIFIQNRLTSEREKIVSREGINSAPSWSPDGKRLAMSLSFEGNPEIYIYDLPSGNLRRVTRNEAIDTEPVWLDDDNIVFTSDRSGGPQLYRMAVAGGRERRLTFEGSYNADAAVSPDGRSIAFVHNDGRGFRIALIDLQSGFFQTLTDGTLDESPSFSPNGQMILYATERDGRGTLGAVAIDGSVTQSLSVDGSVREPAWAPAAP
ncbi:MAG: Tol-Pal system beta propeller repeat protein TolB [Gammaproteobacteria bacterium]|nr:MAG: Tol-Pal system beta propeller repeat protein TolB [Gammaproteobacteria bacterium]